MKKIVYIFLFFISYTVYSQSLAVFDVDTTNYPIVQAKYYAFDALGYQITDLSPSHFVLKESGQIRQVLNLHCPTPKEPVSLSSVLVLDISGSMQGTELNIAKTAAIQWINMLPTEESECAVTSFSEVNYLDQDFTTNKNSLIDAVRSLTCKQGTNYNAAFIDPMAGGILIAKPGKHKKVIVFLTDGFPNFVPYTDRIIKEAKENNITIYCVCVKMVVPQCLVDIAEQTGGKCFGKVQKLEEITGCYSQIFMNTQGMDPCTIQWLSHAYCDSGKVNVEIKLKTTGATAYTSYPRLEKGLANLEVSPKVIKFNNIEPGVQRDTIITVSPLNSDVYVSKITSSNSAFKVTPTEFLVPAGQVKEITISFTPVDGSYQFTEISIHNDLCEVTLYCVGGYKNKKQPEKSLKITQPNGRDIYVVGTDSLITWEGVFPSDKLTLEYSIDKGVTWNFLTDTAYGLSYSWKDIQKPTSSKCLVRGTTDLRSLTQCYEGELIIYNQNWLCANLDVTRYRNGDVIPQVTDPVEWRNLRTGAWCYYNNESAKGELYGKLYNYYAVTDSRGLAPEGWHIPSTEEWAELSKNLGGVYEAGGKLKCIGTKENGQGIWRTPNSGATNESGFSALPSGYRNSSGNFVENEFSTYWWTSTTINSERAFSQYVNYVTPYIFTHNVANNNGFAVRCINDVPYPTIQIDTSNFVFTITEPMAEAKDIDMKQCLIGTVKDSLISDFIINTGLCKLKVDSIYIRRIGKDSAAFFLISGFPKYSITEGQSNDAEFRFVPLRLGRYDAELVIITQSDTIIKKITGESVKPVISVQNKVINFGKVAVGYTRDTTQVITIKNISDSKIHIVEAKHNKPNDYDFTKGNCGAFDLEAHETKKMDLSFCPSAVGRTIGTLEFHYNGLGSPAVVQLYGIGVELIPQTLVAPVNDTINIPLDTRLYWNLNIGQTSYRLQISKDENFTDLLVDSAVTDTVYKCTELDFFDEYYWRVKPGEQAKQEIWSPIWRFTTMMDTVNLQTPQNLLRCLDVKMDLNWEQSIYNNNYRLQIAGTNNFKSKFTDSLLIDNRFNINNLDFSKEYYWRVRNESGDSLGYWSNIWQFKTRMSDISLTYPENTQNGLELKVNFNWSEVIGGDYYQLQISKNNAFTDLVYSMDSLRNSTHIVPDLEPDILYYWRVRVWNNECYGYEYWSDVWTFRTNPTGIKDSTENIKVVPNPAGDYITIFVKYPEGSDIQIYNTFGEKLMFAKVENLLSNRINISTFPKGIYFVKVGNEFIKFVKL